MTSLMLQSIKNNTPKLQQWLWEYTNLRESFKVFNYRFKHRTVLSYLFYQSLSKICQPNCLEIIILLALFHLYQ